MANRTFSKGSKGSNVAELGALGLAMADAGLTSGEAPAPVAPQAPTAEQLRAAQLGKLATDCAEVAMKDWTTADQLRKDAKARTAAVYRSLRVAQTGEGQSPVEGRQTLENAIQALAVLRSGGVAKQVMPNRQSISTTYARALLHPMMSEADKGLIKGWILAGNVLRSGAAEALYKRAEGMGVDLS